MAAVHWPWPMFGGALGIRGRYFTTTFPGPERVRRDTSTNSLAMSTAMHRSQLIDLTRRRSHLSKQSRCCTHSSRSVRHSERNADGQCSGSRAESVASGWLSARSTHASRSLMPCLRRARAERGDTAPPRSLEYRAVSMHRRQRYSLARDTRGAGMGDRDTSDAEPIARYLRLCDVLPDDVVIAALV